MTLKDANKKITYGFLIVLAIVTLTGCVANQSLLAPGGHTAEMNRSSSLFKQNRLAESLSVLLSVAEESSDAPIKAKIADILSKRGLVLFKQGKYTDAIDHFKAATVLQHEIGDVPARAHNLNNLSRLYNIVGDYSSALKSSQEAFQVSEQIENRKELIASRINLGAIQYNLRHYSRAADNLLAAIDLSSKYRINSLTADARFVLGAVYRQQGDFEQALIQYTHALKLNKKLGRSFETAANYRSLGELYLHRIKGPADQNLEDASKYLNLSLAMHKNQKDGLSTAMALSHIGEYYHKKKNYQKAVEKFEEAKNYFETVDYTDGIGRMYIHSGFAVGEMGDWPKAIGHFDKALRAYKKLRDREWIRIALFGKGIYYEKQGDILKAEKNYKDAIAEFESIRIDVAGGKAGAAIFTAANQTLYEKLIELLLSQGRIEEALEYVERSRLRSLRNQLFESHLGEEEVENEKSGLKKLVRLEHEKSYLNEKYGLIRDERSKRLIAEKITQKEIEIKKLQENLLAINPDLRPTLGILPNTMHLYRHPALPKNAAIVTYFATEQTLFVFFTKKNEKVVIRKSEISKTFLKQRVLNTLNLIQNQKDRSFKRGITVMDNQVADSESNLSIELQNLYHDLIGPIEKELEETDTVALLSFSWLSYLPFGALVKKDTDGELKFFAEIKNLVYLSTHSYLGAMKNTQGGFLQKGQSNIIAFGNPDLGDPRFDLRYAEEEVKRIKEFYTNTNVYVRETASKDNFKSNWGKYQIIHIAAHGDLSGGKPSILLSPGGTGKLKMTELLEWPQNQATRFIVLSACQTAIDPVMSRTLKTEEKDETFKRTKMSLDLVSAAHIVLMAKVPTTIATLWNIDDRATAVLMETFYMNLKNGEDPYAAFRNAQLSMIQRNDIYNQPYYWAGFIFFGLNV